MNNSAKKKTEADTELTRVNVSDAMTNSEATATAATKCSPEMCKQARNRNKPDFATDSPWNIKKTYFLIGVLSLFLLWIIIYVIVSRLT